MRPELGPTGALVLTLDVITPLTDDPADFGRIACANAVSDVYAMGGDPMLGLSFIGVPEVVSLEMLEAILRGVNEKAAEAECAIVGGHSIRDSEPKVGLAVVGRVDPARAWTHPRAQAGQRLVLTKPIGTGVIAQAFRSDRVDRGAFDAAVRWMTTLNRRARDIGLAHGVTAATDVTGFGLLGHLRHVVAASALEAVLDVSAIPILDGALDAARAGLVPGGSKRNLRYVAAHLANADRVDTALLTVLADAQTSGGLLLALPPEEADAVVRELGDGSAVIGELRDGTAGMITLSI